MKITFFGVMGSTAGGSSDLGKNTSCVLVKENNTELVFDAGSGIINYMSKTKKKEFHIFISHFHIDHLIGLPYIPQLFNPSYTINFYSPILENETFEKTFYKLFKKPFLPIHSDDIKCTLNFVDVEKNTPIQIDNLMIVGIPVDHPGGSMSYKVHNSDDNIFVYLCDISNNAVKIPILAEFCHNADLIYADAMYIKEEFIGSNFESFGHSSIESIIELKGYSKAKNLYLGHHHCQRKHEELQSFENDGVHIARENETVHILSGKNNER